jgi:hypothetical protein
MYTALYSYTFGYMPTNVKEILLYAAGANTLFAFFKNASTFGTGLVKLVVYVFKSMYQLLFGRPWRTDDAYYFIHEHAVWSQQVKDFTSQPNPRAEEVRKAKVLVVTGHELLLKATNHSMEKDFVQNLKARVSSLATVVGDKSLASEFSDPRPLPVIDVIYGDPGIGKSLLAKCILAALKKKHGWHAPLDKMMDVLTGDQQNFPPPMNEDPKYLFWDDPLPTTDVPSKTEFINKLMVWGSPVPALHEDPIAEQKRFFQRHSYITAFINLVGTTNASSPEAAGRRLTGGAHFCRCNPAYFKPGTTHLDPMKVTASNLDDIWVFLDTEDNVRNFTGYINAKYAKRKQMDLAGAHLNSVAHEIVDRWQNTDDHVGVNPPRTIEIDRSVYATFAELQNRIPGRAEVFESADSGTEFHNESLHCDTSLYDDFCKYYKGKDSKQDYERFVRFLDACPQHLSYQSGKPNREFEQTFGTLEAVVNQLIESRPEVKLDYKVKIGELTMAHQDLLKPLRFYTKGECCRTGNWCFVHGNRICESYDKDAQSLGYYGFIHWASKQNTPIKTYYMHYAASVAPMEGYGWAVTLGTILSFITSAATIVSAGYLISHVVNAYWNRKAEKAELENQATKYSNEVPSRARANVTVRNPWAPKTLKNQGNNMVEANDPTKFVDDKIAVADVFLTWTVTRETKTISAGAWCHRFYSNAAITVSHAIPDGADTCTMGGHFQTRHKAVEFHDFKELEKLPTNVFRYHRSKVSDLACVIFPVQIPSAASTLSYFIKGELDPRRLTGCYMVNHQPQKVDPNTTTPFETSEVSRFPLGDVRGYNDYTVKGISSEGFFTVPQLPTKGGHCGQMVVHTNAHLGEGHRYICAMHASGNDSKDNPQSAHVPVSFDHLMYILNQCPKGIVSGFENQSHPFVEKLLPVGDRDVSFIKKPVAGILPPNLARGVNRKNNIIKSRVAGALDEQVIIDPVTRDHCRFGPSNHAPAPVFQCENMFLKTFPTDTVLQPNHVELFRSASNDYIEEVISQTPLRFHADRLPSWDEVLNGIPEYGINPIVVTTSAGIVPGCGNHSPGKSEHVERDDNGRLRFRPGVQDRVEAKEELLRQGVITPATLVAQPKVELRPIERTTPETTRKGYTPLENGFSVKRARKTETMDFDTLIIGRRYTMVFTAALMHGAIKNSAALGVELNGYSGQILAQQVFDMTYKDSTDAETFDASCPGIIDDAYGVDLARFNSVVLGVPAQATRAVAKMLSQTWTVFGDIFFKNDDETHSGRPDTTPFNIWRGASTYRYCWKRLLQSYKEYFAGKSRIYGDWNFYVHYGDDSYGGTHCELFDATIKAQYAREVGVILTPATKNGEMSPWVDYTESKFLSRRPYRREGRWFWRLEFDTLNSIYQWIINNDIGSRVQTTLVCEAFIRELVLWDVDAAAIASRKLQEALFLTSCPRMTIDVDEVYRGLLSGTGGVHVHDVDYVPDRWVELPTIEGYVDSDPVLVPGEFGFDETEKPKRHMAFYPGPFGPKFGDAPNGLTNQSASNDKDIVPVDASNRADAERGVVTVSGITTHKDDTGIVTTDLSKDIMKRPLPPVIRHFGYKKEEDVDPLYRMYPIAEITWPLATSADTKLASWGFPELLLNNPTIMDRVARNKLFKCSAVKVRATLNGDQYSQGLLFMNFIPNQDIQTPNWRQGPRLWYNGDGAEISASLAQSVEVLLPWTSNFNAFDLQLGAPQGACGALEVWIMTKLSYEQPSPPSGMTVLFEACFINPDLSQPDINSFATTAIRAKKYGPAPFGLQNQSAAVESTAKGSATDAVKSATETVAGVLKFAETVAPVVGALLDKPLKEQTMHMDIQVAKTDFATTSGLSYAIPMALIPAPYVTTRNPAVNSTNPKPSLVSLAMIPQIVGKFTMAANAAAGDLVGEWTVSPGAVYSPAENVFAPGWPGYVGSNFTMWRGSMRYRIRIVSAQVKSCRLRLFYLPSAGSGTAVAIADRGDAPSIVMDVNGDTIVRYSVRWEASAYTKYFSWLPSLTLPTFNLGRCLIQVEVPYKIATITPAEIIVYGSMDTDAQFYEPIDLDASFAPDFNAPSIQFGKKFGSAPSGLKFQSIRADFATQKFPPIMPVSMQQAHGFISGDQIDNYSSLLKRNTLEYYNQDNPVVIFAAPNTGALGLQLGRSGCVSGKCWLLAGFVGYSGGLNISAYVADDAQGTWGWAVYASDDVHQAFTNPQVPYPPRGMAGAIPWNKPSNPLTHMVEVAVPYSQSTSYREVFDTHNYENARGLEIWAPNANAGGDSPNPVFDVYMSFMDDVCVYFPASPPICNYIVSDRKAKKIGFKPALKKGKAKEKELTGRSMSSADA